MKKSNTIVKIIGILLLINTTVTASNIPKGSFESGIFQPLRYGYSDNVEISSHPFLLFVIPNVSIQKSYSTWQDLEIFSMHSIVIPTPLLRKVTKSDIAGFISPEFEIPIMISLKNEVKVNRSFNTDWNIGAKAGLAIAWTKKDLDNRTTIDLPIIFPRLGVYYNGHGLNLGMNINGNVLPKINLLTDLNILLLPGADEDIFFEHKSLMTWYYSEKTKFQLGYKFVYGEYPFGSMWHLLPIPLFDIVWSW